MYVASITLENIRTFAAEKTVTFNHPDSQYGEGHALVDRAEAEERQSAVR